MKKLFFIVGLFIPSLSFAGFTTNNLTATSTFTVTQSTMVFNGTTYYWQAGSGSAGQFLRTDGNSPATLTFGTASGGGGGSSSLAVSSGGVTISSPTSMISFFSPILVSLGGSSTAQIRLDGSSVTLQGQSVLSFSSATATYLQISSALANFIINSSDFKEGAVFNITSGTFSGSSTIGALRISTAPSKTNITSGNQMSFDVNAGVVEMELNEGNVTYDSSIQMINGNYAIFYSPDNVSYTGLKSANSPYTNVIYTLPPGDADGYLKSDGAGVLSWTTPSSGGGGSPLAVLNNGTEISSPTLAIDFRTPIIATLGGSSTAQITLNASSVTLQGQSVLSFSSATATYINKGSTLAASNLIGTVPVISIPNGNTNYIQVSSGTTVQAAGFNVRGSTVANLTITGFTQAGIVETNSSGVLTVSTYVALGAIGISFDGGGSAYVAGSTSTTTLPYDLNITSWTVTTDVAGLISIDIKRSTFANYPTLTSIVGAGNKPSISAALKNAAVPAGWTSTSLNAGDSIAFVIDASTTITRGSVTLWGTRP